MKDIIGNDIKVGDVCITSVSKSQSLNTLGITEVKPGAIAGFPITYEDSRWKEGKRASDGVVKLTEEQKAILFNNNPDYATNYGKLMHKHNIKP